MLSTYPIIINPKIYFDISNKDISKGKLLLLKKIASHSNTEAMISFIISNKYLFNNLYPILYQTTNNIKELDL